MLVVTAALQVSEQIKDAGAYAGLASILGLAVLSLLYFGQARELKRLREWAGRAPERTAELQEQANAAAAAAQQRRVTAQPVAAAPAVRSSQTPATAAGAARPAPAVPAGQAVPAAGAPAVAAAAAAGGIAAPAGAPAAPPAAAGTATAPGSPGAAPGVAGATGVAGAPGAPTPPGTPAPPAVPGANGTSVATPGGQPTQALPAVDPDAPVGQDTDDVPVPLRQMTGAPRPRAGSEALPPAAPESPSRRPSRRTLGIAGGVLAALLLVVVLATQVLGGDDPEPQRAGTASASTDSDFAPPTTGAAKPTAPAVDPATVNVFVLNGTQTNGLAAEVAKTLEVARFKTAGTNTASVATTRTTTVYYAPDKKRAASAVAKELGVSAANVKPIVPEISVQGSPEADVTVLMGADKATQ